MPHAVLGIAEAREIPPEEYPENFDPARHVYAEYIQSVPDWRRAVLQNRAALRWCDAVVLLLPAGCDAHADWAFGVGLGKLTLVAGSPPAGERTPTHMWADGFVARDDEVCGWLAREQQRLLAIEAQAVASAMDNGLPIQFHRTCRDCGSSIENGQTTHRDASGHKCSGVFYLFRRKS